MTGPVIIGENAWVAAEAYIGPGVTLGAGAVAGARAVVVRDVPAGAVVVGNPARLVTINDEKDVYKRQGLFSLACCGALPMVRVRF